MFAHSLFRPPRLTGDAVVDVRELSDSIYRYFLSLNDKGALAIVEEGLWTPALTFATPGDVSVTYTTQYGRYWVFGSQVTAQFLVVTSAFTHTTASGVVRLTGLPLTSDANGNTCFGTCIWAGITKANYTQVVPRVIVNVSYVDFLASGSGQAQSSVTAADMPTGGSVVLSGNVVYSVE